MFKKGGDKHMENWVCCPECGKRLIKETNGNTRIEGGSLKEWCKRCKISIEIYGNCQTRVVANQ